MRLLRDLSCSSVAAGADGRSLADEGGRAATTLLRREDDGLWRVRAGRASTRGERAHLRILVRGIG